MDFIFTFKKKNTKAAKKLKFPDILWHFMGVGNRGGGGGLGELKPPPLGLTVK